MKEYRGQRVTLRVNWIWGDLLLWGLALRTAPWHHGTLYLGPLALILLRTNTFRHRVG